jgi:hypothetical protein
MKDSRVLNTPARLRGRGWRFAVCVDNESYGVSLERNKIYVVLRDKDAESGGDVRVIDESGEDYLFSAARFVPIDLPARVKALLLTTPRRGAQRRRRR